MRYGRNINRPGFYRGRPTRNENGHPGGGGGATQTTGGDNGGGAGGGNSDAGASADSGANNAGDDFDPTAFWGGSAPGAAAAPNGESAGGGGGESSTNGGQQQQQNGLATQLSERLNGLTFGNNIFDAEVADQINDGNFTGIQDRFNEMGRSMVRESMAMMVQVLKPFSEQLLEQMRNEQQQTLTNRDNTESLERLFPAAKNPAMAKVIQPIYDQALRNAGGNREKAVAQAKQMLRFMAGEAAGDLGIEIAPRGSGDRGSPINNYNWLDDLTGRAN